MPQRMQRQLLQPRVSELSGELPWELDIFDPSPRIYADGTV
jgi:hypothetical protein